MFARFHWLLERIQHRNSGSAAVEFALIAVPVFLLLFGTIEFARLYWTSSVLNDTAAIAARCIGFPEPDCVDESGQRNEVKTKMKIRDTSKGKGVLVDEERIFISFDSSCNNNGAYVQIIIELNFETVLGQHIPLQATACHVVQPGLSI